MILSQDQRITLVFPQDMETKGEYMSSFVTIKSFSNGLKVFLDESCAFEEIEKEIKDKFEKSHDFFKGGKIAISFEGRNLTDKEERILTKIMEEAADLTILYVIGKDDETNQSFAKAVERPLTRENDCFDRIYSGSVKQFERLETKGNIVVLGDVEPGATIITDGNIIILGGLYGSAIINAKKDIDKLFIAANDVSAEKIQIGLFDYYSKEKSKWVVKPKMVPKIAFISQSQVVLEPISKSSLSHLCNNINNE